MLTVTNDGSLSQVSTPTTVSMASREEQEMIVDDISPRDGVFVKRKKKNWSTKQMEGAIKERV